MLVLSRTPGEMVYIDDRIVIRIVSITRDRVKLAIAAPDDVKVYRDELLGFDDRARIEAAAGIKQDTRS